MQILTAMGLVPALQGTAGVADEHPLILRRPGSRPVVRGVAMHALAGKSLFSQETASAVGAAGFEPATPCL